MVYAFYDYVLLGYEILTNRIVQSLNSNLFYIVDVIIIFFKHSYNYKLWKNLFLL